MSTRETTEKYLINCQDGARDVERATIKGIAEEDLIEGAEIAGAPKTMAFLASGAKVLA